MHILEAGSGQKAFLTFSEKTSEVSALLVSKDGSSKAVANENLPKDLKMIKSLDSFNSFLENAQARRTILSNGEAKLYVQQKGFWGGGRFNFNPNYTFNSGPMQPPAGHAFLPPSQGQIIAAQGAQFAAQQAAIQAHTIAHLGGQHVPQMPNVPNIPGFHFEATAQAQIIQK